MVLAFAFAVFVVVNAMRESMKAIEKNLLEILDKMEVPAMRKELNAHNLRWLGRNLAIFNQKHSEFPTAMHFIKTLLYMGGDTEPLIVNGVTPLGEGQYWLSTDEVITPQKAAELLGKEPPFDGLNRSEN